MRKLNSKTRALIIRLLVEGNSISAISGIADVSKNTVSKLLIDAGKACAKYHDENVRDVKAVVIECTEVWSFSCPDRRDIVAAKKSPKGDDEIWTFAAIDSNSKLIMSYVVGSRDSKYAIGLLDDLRSRITHQVELIPLGIKAHNENIGGGANKTQIGPFYAEHREQIAGLSKKVKIHMHAVALHFMYYNFVKVHQKLKVTPAMKAGLADHLWDAEDLLAIIDANESPPIKRGPYKKRVSK